jgi:hypothetical protein
MKFYRDYGQACFNHIKIRKYQLDAIYMNYLDDKKIYLVRFFKNGKTHNIKNFAYLYDIYKTFCINGKTYSAEDYGNQDKFTKQSWRRFAKLQYFL